MITIFILLSVVARYSADTTTDTITPYIIGKTVSIVSKKYEKYYDMKISPFIEIPCKSMDTLKLEGMNLNIIKDNLIQSDTIRHISFRNNFLTSMPATILKRVQGLICLDLSENKINFDNDNFIEHDNLQVLDLSYQNPEFTKGSESEVGNLKENETHIQLKIFNTSGIYLPNLEHLFLIGNDITSLSETFSKSFPKLIYMYLNNINATTINQDFFNKIPKTLRVLHLENNKLSNLTLQNMTEITDLYLDGNPLENVEIVSKKLKILSLSYGAAMGHINLYTPYLEYLDLSHNNFHFSHSNIQHDNIQLLKTLLLDYNKFSDFPFFGIDLSLIRLSLSYNKLTHITSKYFQHIMSLKMLSLRGNKIKNIEKDAFKGLNHLEFLDLSENEITKLPNDWILPLTNLRFLNASSNHFATILEISISSFHGLTHLFVEDNYFTGVTTRELDTLPNLITVYLD